MKAVDAYLTRIIQEGEPTAMVYKNTTDQLKFVNYTIEMQDKLGGTHMVMLGEKFSEAKAAALVMVKAMKARSTRIVTSARALDPTCWICGVMDCLAHREWKACFFGSKHVCYWDPALYVTCPSCKAEGR